MPERGFTILATGPIPAAETDPALLPANVYLDIISFIRITPVGGTAAAERILELSRKPINAIFTSVEAIRAVKRVSTSMHIPACFSLSGPTENLSRDWLGDETNITSAPDASALADRTIAAGVKEAVFFCGNQRRDALPARLKKAGINLEEVTVYDTVASPVKLDKTYDAILFFSPSAVNSFFSVNSISAQTAVFALGPTTAEALKLRINNAVSISEQPDKIYLLQKVLAYACAHPIL